MIEIMFGGFCMMVGGGLGFWVGRKGVKQVEETTLAALADLKQHVTETYTKLKGVK